MHLFSPAAMEFWSIHPTVFFILQNQFIDILPLGGGNCQFVVKKWLNEMEVMPCRSSVMSKLDFEKEQSLPIILS
jgi:hypothetical protein